MAKQFDPQRNYLESMKAIGFVPLKEATEEDWKRIGFMSGLEVHQQLNTREKLFCRCPAGILLGDQDYDGELIRHMRPTLSEMGEYDGTALMEFKTRKEITYRINNINACTYDIDDTPPFKINREALEYALEISLLSNLNIVGEVHITRKQYLDGSIPTGFQRTAILGVEGEISLSNKKVRLLQLSIEEDSCREISDIGHKRIYKTDRLGMPLIETVTHPDCLTPHELHEACDYIRFLNRSTGKVRTGMGAARQDVNVSCRGGDRVEIKGVAHTKWIPLLSHNEAFRQTALLRIRTLLNERIPSWQENWHIKTIRLDLEKLNTTCQTIQNIRQEGFEAYAANLPSFKGILSHFTQPGKCFADEITDRLKVIACLEKPNMIFSEQLNPSNDPFDFEPIKQLLGSTNEDAQIVFWGPAEDIKTAIETIQERCLIAFEMVPRETRKAFSDGTTIFERVLPGADRMYPDTDSAPIPLPEEYIQKLRKKMPVPVSQRIQQMQTWGIPSDTWNYLLRKNLVPLIEKISADNNYPPKLISTFLGHTLKHLEGKIRKHSDFNYQKIAALFNFINKNQLDTAIAKPMVTIMMQNPKMDFDSILTSLKFKKRSREELLAPVGFLVGKFREIRKNDDPNVVLHWLMGQVRRQAMGNIPLSEYSSLISKLIEKEIVD
ncbi:MAG: Glu-tRNA(Gln) amidotransferase subunit GatE [Bacteroidales bacterium]|jgi:glutamyl-tRNA(Gln) amidotransferase subunit E|nr:Glu-tRNA(Gln) amidotransferase subunit GatE [Bacteroidales bacterium]MDD4811585.1 Glu-tRNA(Gln) amidotransferase subunit GatE [Bacteroidales bacterium]